MKKENKQKVNVSLYDSIMLGIILLGIGMGFFFKDIYLLNASGFLSLIYIIILIYQDYKNKK